MDMTKIFVRANAYIIKITHGWLGGQLGTQQVLLLKSVGRKSGKTYHTPLAFYRDAEKYLVVASNWGKEIPPEWFRNLQHQSETSIEVKGISLRVKVSLPDGPEYQRLWTLVTRQNGMYLGYQKKMKRQIPIVVLTPLG